MKKLIIPCIVVSILSVGLVSILGSGVAEWVSQSEFNMTKWDILSRVGQVK